MRDLAADLTELHMLVLGVFRFDVAATAEGVAAALAIDGAAAQAADFADLEREILLTAEVEQ